MSHCLFLQENECLHFSLAPPVCSKKNECLHFSLAPLFSMPLSTGLQHEEEHAQPQKRKCQDEPSFSKIVYLEII
jgi:hypothetical protein